LVINDKSQSKNIMAIFNVAYHILVNHKIRTEDLLKDTGVHFH